MPSIQLVEGLGRQATVRLRHSHGPQRGDAELVVELCAERLGNVAHVVKRRGAPRKPTPQLPAPIRGHVARREPCVQLPSTDRNDPWAFGPTATIPTAP